MVAVDGIGSTWTTNNGSLYVGGYVGGTLSITNGGSVSSLYGYIDSVSGSTSIVTVDGVGSTWTNTSYLYIGYGGNGTLSISHGGCVNSTGTSNYIGNSSVSMGVVKVDGAGSTWANNGGSLYVGEQGSGTLSITHGGSVTSGNACIGDSYASTGTVIVDGTGSTWINNATGGIIVGNRGKGTLLITNGGSVSGPGYIGNNSGSTGAVTVDGTGSTWTNTSYLYIGYGGSGTLSITHGGRVSSTGINNYIGSGTVMVDGIGSIWTNTGSVSVGSGGCGTLSITNGGNVTSYDGLISAGSAVTVTGAGSAWTNTGDISVGNLTSINNSGIATLAIALGGTVTSRNGYIGTSGPGSAVTVDGSGSTWTNSGGLTVGGSGVLSITGGGTVVAASINTSLLEIDVGRGSSLTVGGGNGTITNNGIIRILAGAGVAADDILVGKKSLNPLCGGEKRRLDPILWVVAIVGPARREGIQSYLNKEDRRSVKRRSLLCLRAVSLAQRSRLDYGKGTESGVRTPSLCPSACRATIASYRRLVLLLRGRFVRFVEPHLVGRDRFGHSVGQENQAASHLRLVARRETVVSQALVGAADEVSGLVEESHIIIAVSPLLRDVLHRHVGIDDRLAEEVVDVEFAGAVHVLPNLDRRDVLIEGLLPLELARSFLFGEGRGYRGPERLGIRQRWRTGVCRSVGTSGDRFLRQQRLRRIGAETSLDDRLEMLCQRHFPRVRRLLAGPFGVGRGSLPVGRTTIVGVRFCQVALG